MDTADAPGPPTRRSARPAVLVGALVIALAVVAAVVLTGHGHRHHDGAAGPGGGLLGATRTDPGADSGAGTGADSGTDFHAGDADLVVLDGVSGRIRVTASDATDAVAGTYRRGDGAPARVRASVDRAAGARTVTVACESGDGSAVEACAGDLTLTVPRHTGLRLRQTSGETVLDGLGGRLTLAVASDRLTAAGLRTPRAEVTVTSGSADLGFTRAPDALTVRATSASTALRLPAGAGDTYAVTSSAVSADVRVKVPVRDDAPHRLALRVESGSLAVMPA